MSQSTAIKTYDAVGRREDLTDVVSTITRAETPLFSKLRKVVATNTLHEWQTDTLSTGSDNAAIEGADFSFAIPGSRSRLSAYTQIFAKTAEVTRTQKKALVAGIEDEMAYQMEKRMKEIATDVEKALITGTGNSGASGTARRLKGILSWMTSNVETGTGTGSEALTESMYNGLLQKIWDNGGRPDLTLVNSFQKRKISSFSTSNTRYLSMDDKLKLTNAVAIYESDFGVQSIELDPFMTTSVVAVLQTDLWAVAVYDGIHTEDVAKIGDADRMAIVGELTLEARNQAGSGQITGLTTS